MSFLKYQEDATLKRGNGRGGLSFSRAAMDGAPFRGPTALLREEEYRDFTERVYDFDIGIFDLRDPEDYRKIREIFDRAANQWYKIVDYDKHWGEDKDGNTTVLVYLAWAVPHMELAKGRFEGQAQYKPIPAGNFELTG